MSEFIIRPYQKGDEIAINNTFNQVFGTDRSIEEWYWKKQPEILLCPTSRRNTHL